MSRRDPKARLLHMRDYAQKAVADGASASRRGLAKSTKQEESRMSQSFESRALRELANLSEKQLQGMIIEPLLTSLGFENVRDNAGSGEKGKDLIATKTTEFGRIKLYSIQIKKKRFTGRIDSIQSLGSLFHQLIQARDEVVVDPTTNLQRSPDACIFITPYPIAPSTWERFHKLSQDLYKQNIEIIDGSTLLDLVRRHIPDFLKHFSMEVWYRYQLARSLNRIPESTGAFSLQKELELTNIYIDANLDNSGKSLESIATRRLWLQGSKLVTITNSQLSTLTQFGAWFGRGAEVNDPPHVISDEEKKRLSKLKETIPRKSDRRVVQINLDPLIAAVQEKARNALRRLAGLTPGTSADMCTTIALEFIETKERVGHLTDFDPLMDHWLSFVVRDGAIEWPKPSIRIPSSILNTISCNKYILGVPGAGKTTLLRHLARELAGSSDDVLPVFLPLLLVKEPTRNTLIETCIRQLEDQGYVLGGGKKPIDVFLKKAARGEFQLFLDGLDEVGSDAAALLKVIEEFAQYCPKLRIVLSCRSTSDIPPFKGALELQMTPLSKEQLSEFLDKWFSSQPTAAADLRSWLKSNKKMRDAAANPLIAALLCSLFYLGAEMPTTEAELHKRRFELLLGKWDQVKGICRLNTDLIKRYWKFISELAFTMHQRELRVISVSEADEIASNYFSRTYHGDPNGMIRDCVHRGVLEYESLGGLSFGHLTYQEYLVARKIALDNDVGFVLKRIDSPWWKNVMRFYASAKEDISSLIRSALDSECSVDVLKELEQLLELAPWTDKYLVREVHQAADLLS